MSPSWKEAEGTDGQKKILPMKSSMEDAGKNDWHDQQDDDGVEDKTGNDEDNGDAKADANDVDAFDGDSENNKGQTNL